MRRQKFWWTFLVGGIVCSVYGGYTLFYRFQHNNSLSVHSLILLIIGSLALIIFLILYLISLIEKKKNEKLKAEEKTEYPPIEPETEEKIEPVVEQKKNEETTYSTTTSSKSTTSYKPSTSRSRYDGCDAYVKKVG